MIVSGCASQDTPIGTGSCTTCKSHADAGNGSRADAGPPDAGPADGGVPDAGLRDAGPDGGGRLNDAGLPDAGAVDGGPLTGQVCPSGSITFGGRTYDQCQKWSDGTDVPIDGVQIATLEPYSATVSADGGYYTACMPQGQPATLQFAKSGYVTSYLAEMNMATPLPFGAANIGMASILCSSAETNFATEIPGFNSSDGIVFSEVLSISNAPPCGGEDGGLAGWIFVASPADDGGTADAGVWEAVYIDPSGTLQAIGSTLDDGQAIILNIDPSVEYVNVSGSKAADGIDCENLNVAVNLTGRVYVAPHSISVIPWVIP